MSLWLNAYLRAIEERDSKEKANESLFDTCVFMNQKTLWRNFFIFFIRGQALYIDEINKPQIRGWQTGRPILLLLQYQYHQSQRQRL